MNHIFNFLSVNSPAWHDFITAPVIATGMVLIVLPVFVFLKKYFCLFKKRAFSLMVITMLIAMADMGNIGFDNMFYTSEFKKTPLRPKYQSLYYNNRPAPLSAVIDLDKTPLGARGEYLIVAKKAAALCGRNIGLKRYTPRDFGYNDVEILNVEKYYFTPGACYNKKLPSNINIHGYEFIEVDFDKITVEVSEPHSSFLEDKYINPVDVSKWKISADEAMKIVLKNGGQSLLDQGLHLRGFFLNQGGWTADFILYASGHGGFSAVYKVNAETGEMTKTESDHRNEDWSNIRI